jgi:hypothetical protein
VHAPLVLVCHNLESTLNLICPVSWNRLWLWQAGGMARGWESKAVESQIESAEAENPSSRRVQVNPEQLTRQRERESIELSRTRVLQDLASAVNPKYRELLQRSLQYLNEKLAALDRPSRPDRREQS